MRLSRNSPSICILDLKKTRPSKYKTSCGAITRQTINLFSTSCRSGLQFQQEDVSTQVFRTTRKYMAAQPCTESGLDSGFQVHKTPEVKIEELFVASEVIVAVISLAPSVGNGVRNCTTSGIPRKPSRRMAEPLSNHRTTVFISSMIFTKSLINAALPTDMFCYSCRVGIMS